MGERSPGPAVTAGASLHQSPCGPRDHGPSLPLRITSRLAGIRGGPRGAVSDVGDPTERLTSVTALRRARTRRCAAPGPTRPAQGVSPDIADSSTFAASPPSRLSNSGRIVLRAFGPRPRRPGPAGPAGARRPTRVTYRPTGPASGRPRPPPPARPPPSAPRGVGAGRRPARGRSASYLH